MNVIFAVVFLSSIVAISVTAPQTLVQVLSGGAEKSLKLTFTLMVAYTVWLGLFQIIEDALLTQKLAKIMRKPVRLIFGKLTERENEYLSMNVTANLIGIGAVATPTGIKVANLLDERNATFQQNMLFAVSASSLQLLPTTVISLRAQAGCMNPADIILPTLLSTAVSTVCAVLLTMVFCKK